MSNILELYFNSKNNSNGLAVSRQIACFEPNEQKEYKLGSLYIFSELRNMPQKGESFLNRIIGLLEKSFYSFTNKESETKEFSFNDNFSKTLERVNEFLVDIPKKEGFNLGGNLSACCIAISQDLLLSLSRITSVKIFLLRNGQILNIGDSLPSSNYGLFSNSIEGNLENNDKIVVFSKDLLNFFETNGILNELSPALSIKEIKKVIKSKKKILKQISGACLIIFVKKQKHSSIKIPNIPKINIPKDNFLSRLFEKILPQSPTLKSVVIKIIISLGILAILLLLGHFIFRK